MKLRYFFLKWANAPAASLFLPLPPPGCHIFWCWGKMNILYCLFTARKHLVREDCARLLFKTLGMTRCVWVWWLSAVAAQFKGFILYNNRQTDGANRAHPPDVESDTLQCLCCLSAACSYTIHTLTSRQHAYTYRHETVELIGNLYFIMESLVHLQLIFFCLYFCLFFLSLTCSHWPPDNLSN